MAETLVHDMTGASVHATSANQIEIRTLSVSEDEHSREASQSTNPQFSRLAIRTLDTTIQMTRVHLLSL